MAAVALCLPYRPNPRLLFLTSQSQISLLSYHSQPRDFELLSLYVQDFLMPKIPMKSMKLAPEIIRKKLCSVFFKKILLEILKINLE